MSRQAIHEMQAELCRALGSPLRMEIMDLLHEGPKSVGEIAGDTGRSPAVISRNLSVLRNARIVAGRREGSNILYRVANPKLMRVCDLMREALADWMAGVSRIVDNLSE